MWFPKLVRALSDDSLRSCSTKAWKKKRSITGTTEMAVDFPEVDMTLSLGKELDGNKLGRNQAAEP